MVQPSCSKASVLATDFSLMPSCVAIRQEKMFFCINISSNFVNLCAKIVINREKCVILHIENEKINEKKDNLDVCAAVVRHL